MYSIEFRKAVLKLYDYFQSMRKTAKALDVSISSISRWTKDLYPKVRQRVATKTSDALVAFIKTFVSTNPATTSIEIAAQVLKHFGFPVSKQLISVILHRLGFSFKRIRKRGKSSKKNVLLQTFIEKYQTFSPNVEIVAIDESGFDHFPVPIYGYAPKGQPAIIEYTPSNDRTRYSLLMAIAKSGKSFSSIEKSMVNGDIFSSFIQTLPFSSNTILLMDNASIHKTKQFKEIVASKGFEVIYTPPYSPEFNPIELVFGIIKKKFYKSRYNNDNQLPNIIQNCVCSVDSTIIRNCFSHVERIIEAMKTI
jgi:transposase